MYIHIQDFRVLILLLILVLKVMFNADIEDIHSIDIHSYYQKLCFNACFLSVYF